MWRSAWPTLRSSRPEIAASAARVVVVSDFVLGVLRRFPEQLVERLHDRAPLTPETLAAQFDLGSKTEAAAMTELRRVRNVELARIAWRDLAGWADLDTTLADTSLLADCLIAAAASFAADRARAALRPAVRRAR